MRLTLAPTLREQKSGVDSGEVVEKGCTLLGEASGNQAIQAVVSALH